MKFYSGSLVLVEPEAQTIFDGAGSTEDSMNEQFGILATDMEKGLREGNINNIGDVLDTLSKREFFVQHMMTVGIMQFLSNYATALMMIQKERKEKE